MTARQAGPNTQGGGPSHRGFVRQFLASLSAETYSQAVTIVTQLMVLPLMLHLWGAERYGAWLLISAIPGYLALADLGVSNILANRAAMQVGAGEISAARVTNQTAWLMTLIVIAVGLALSLLAFIFLPVELLTRDAAQGARDRGAVAVLGLLACTTLWFGTVGAAMRAVGWYAWLSFSNATIRGLESAALVIVAFMGGDFLAAALAMLGTRLAISLGIVLRFSWLKPEFRFSLKEADVRLLRNMAAPSAAYFSYTLSNLINIQGATIVAGLVAGPSAAVTLNATRTLARLGRMLSSIVNYSLEPAFARLQGANQHNLISTAYRYLKFGTILGVIAYIFAMFSLGPTFISFWTHGEVSDFEFLFYLLVVSVAFEIIWVSAQVPYVATNQHSYFAVAFLLCSVAGLLVLVPLAISFGTVAAGWTAVLVQCATLLLTLRAIRRHGGFSGAKP